MMQAKGKGHVKGRLARWAGFPRALLADRSGGALVFSALALPVILGAAALALDVASWYSTKRQIQTVADAAAMAGVHVLASGGTQTEAETAARTHAQARLGFIDDAKRDIQVTYDDGVTSGTGFEAISVTTTQRREALLSSVFMADAQSVSANATAANQVRGESCVLSLEETAGPALSVTGTADVSGSCGFASNSSAANSINVDGSATLTADQLLTYGEINDADETRINGGDTSNTTENFFRLDDPYADLVVPTIAGCDYPGATNIAAPGATTLSPGVYCNNINLAGVADVTFDPGVYILRNANLLITADATIQGDGVTIIFTGTQSNLVGSITINGTGIVDLSAPDANGQTDPNYLGDYAGILFFTDPTANAGLGGNFGGTGTVILDGAIYMPSRDVSFAGNSSAAPTGCLQIVAESVSFTGTSSLDNTTVACEALGLIEIGERRVRLTL
jgi:Flp pilus assembly protein TadG